MIILVFDRLHVRLEDVLLRHVESHETIYCLTF